ncbi:MAG: transglycosylase SLT domain-containing protein [Rhizomicrobium sp.]
MERPAALPPAILAIALFAAALVLGLILDREVAPPRLAAKPAAHRIAPRLAARKPAVAKPVAAKPAARRPPSAFAIEQAMNSRQLMDRWTPYIREASRRFDVNGQWIRAVMVIESGGRTMLGENKPIVSSAGAMGLMQLMPQTWAEMRAANRLGRDPFDPRDNVLAGAAYLRALYSQYGYPTMFAAYNDGPGMLAAHAALKEPIPAETANYVRDIASILGTGVRYRAGSRQAFAPLTRPDGSTVMIDAGVVVAIRAPLPGEYAATVQSVISIGRLRQGVREAPARATAIVRSHGGLI